MAGMTRRQFVIGTALSGLALTTCPVLANQQGSAPAATIMRAIPSSGEKIPVIGMGTWITFNVGSDPYLIDQRTRVLEAFLDTGGSVVDCSPMYGSSAQVVGRALEALQAHDRVFSASKVWTADESATRKQTEMSLGKWGVDRFDLQQIHNLVGWQGHLDRLREMKASGDIRYLGITTSHGRRHQDLVRIMETEELDFVQLTYNVLDREAEERLLPVAQERGIAVLVNRPFQGGQLFRRYDAEPLPEWAPEAGINSWAELFLKYVISHPAVTCAIPATSKVEHMKENMAALYGNLPTPSQRQQLAAHVRAL
ncbi:aldo/keto reductase [Marinobacter salinisoli]|uniref:Aldo/keto reductase n=1 Tax=Marinobacter salinisoli TaxID=2769486 RepID=A0ABX7MVD5_9GAMM|nr:aldo/keto reductase [Marinobacter salinisoli]QSP96352.1 aldo/keto reductase [Marinobacter salinisoli]